MTDVLGEFMLSKDIIFIRTFLNNNYSKNQVSNIKIKISPNELRQRALFIIWKSWDGVYTLCEKFPYSELFRFVFSFFRTEYGDLLCKSPYSILIWENTDQKNAEYGHFLRNDVTDETTQKNFLEVIISKERKDSF